MTDRPLVDGAEIIGALLKNWAIILGVALVCAMLVLGISLLRPPGYTATSDLSYQRLDRRVSLQSNVQSTEPPRNLDTTRDELVALAGSPTVTRAVMSRLAGSLPPAYTTPAALSQAVRVTPASTSRVISISATTSDPELSSAIASAYADVMLQEATRLDQADAEMEHLEQQLQAAQAAYESRQNDLSESPLNLEVARREQQLQDIEAGLRALNISRERAISDTLTLEAQRSARLLNAYLNDYWNGRIAPIESAQESQRRRLTSAYNAEIALEEARSAAETMRAQIAAGATPSQFAAPFAALQVQVFTNASDQPIMVDSGTSPAAPSVEDVDMLLRSIDDRLAAKADDIAAAIDELRQHESGEMLDSSPREVSAEAIDNLRAIVNQDAGLDVLSSLLNSDTDDAASTHPLRTQLEQQYQALKRELDDMRLQLHILTEQRDVARSTFSALTRRVGEVQLNQALSAITVERVNPSPVVEPVGRGVLRSTITGGILGVLLGILIVLLRLYIPRIRAMQQAVAM